MTRPLRAVPIAVCLAILTGHDSREVGHSPLIHAKRHAAVGAFRDVAEAEQLRAVFDLKQTLADISLLPVRAFHGYSAKGCQSEG
ncbi:hypothetical protein [Methylobacterium sp. CM6247]